MLRRREIFLLLLILALALGGCANQTRMATEALTLSPESLQMRQLQTRRFDTSDERAMLTASAAVLQDLGFTIDESNHELGVIVCSKQRDATNAGQVVLAVFVAALAGQPTPVDQQQTIRVSLVTRPVARKAEAAVSASKGPALTADGIKTTCDAFRAKLTKNYQDELAQLLEPAAAKEMGEKLSEQSVAELRKALTLRMNSTDYGATSVRVTFQRVVIDTQGRVTRQEALTDPAMYQEFFEKLSKSVFLEAQDI